MLSGVLEAVSAQHATGLVSELSEVVVVAVLRHRNLKASPFLDQLSGVESGAVG